MGRSHSINGRWPYMKTCTIFQLANDRGTDVTITLWFTTTYGTQQICFQQESISLVNLRCSSRCAGELSKVATLRPVEALRRRARPKVLDPHTSQCLHCCTACMCPANQKARNVSARCVVLRPLAWDLGEDLGIPCRNAGFEALGRSLLVPPSFFHFLLKLLWQSYSKEQRFENISVPMQFTHLLITFLKPEPCD